MARMFVLIVSAIAITMLVNVFAAGVNEPDKTDTMKPEINEPISAAKPRARISTVTIVDFYMRDGNTVTGRLLSDDTTQLTIEIPYENGLITKNFSKREVDTRSIKKRQVQEWQYYSGLAEYFNARTWDFIDDPDDFIEAIRCYEKAKQSLEASGDNEKISDIDKAIKKVQDDRQVWTREVESRAKLKKLEYDAEAENRLKKLERTIIEGNAKLGESIKNMDKTAEDLKKDYQNLQNDFGQLNKDMVKQLNTVQTKLNDHSSIIDNMWVRIDVCCRR